MAVKGAVREAELLLQLPQSVAAVRNDTRHQIGFEPARERFYRNSVVEISPSTIATPTRRIRVFTSWGTTDVELWRSGMTSGA